VRGKSLPPCPRPGTGVHSWILATANRCRILGWRQTEAAWFIADHISRSPSPPDEIQTAVRKAYSSDHWQTSSNPGSVLHLAQRTPIPLTNINFDLGRLAAVANRITSPANWRHWLWERSPKRPDAMNAFSLLPHLYEQGDKVLVFDRLEDKCPLETLIVGQPIDCRVPPLIRSGGRYGRGIWFLCNPVDGNWHDTGERGKDLEKAVSSCRNHQAITRWRFAVLESDQAPATVWLAFVAQLPMRISSIYTSGGRSFHTLIRLDATSKAEWDTLISPLKRPLKVLGADPGALSAVRLTRLPGCWRPEKGGFQKLLYLHPDPPEIPLIDLPALRSRPWALARWRRDCPRWDRTREAFQ
jgi:hypothetical protein